MKKISLLLLPLLLIFYSSQSQDIKGLYFDQEIGIIEHLNDTIPNNITLINEQGEQVNFKDIIDKPTVLMFVYFRCPGICSPLMGGVAEVISKSDMTLGKDYQVVTISFDPKETSELSIKKKKNYLSLIGQQNPQGWQFFTSDSANIARVTSSVGFRYKRTGTEYLHAATIILLSPQGKITRYLNGTYFLPFEFKLAVIEASKGQAGPTINKILQFCYSFDPVGQTYVLNITKIAAILIISMGLLFFLTLQLRKSKSRHK